MELTTDNVRNFLLTSYPEMKIIHMNFYQKFPSNELLFITEYEKIFKMLLEEFFPGYTINDNFFVKNEGILPIALAYTDDKFFSKRNIKNVTCLSFESLYPHIMLKITDLNNVSDFDHLDEDPWSEEIWNDIKSFQWNSKEVFEMYKFLVINKKELFLDDNDDFNSLIRSLINAMYGVIRSNKSWIKVKNYGLVLEETADILKTIRDKFAYEVGSIFDDEYEDNKKTYLIFANVDQMFFTNFDEIKDDVENILEDFGYPYKLEIYSDLFYVDINNYILVNENKIKKHGFYELKSN